MALSAKSVRVWSVVHKWSSLICTVFLLLLCITGLPLIFHHEIDQLIQQQTLTHTEIQGNGKTLSLDSVVQQAKQEKPDWALMFLTWNKDAPVVSAVIGPSMQATESDVHIVPFDSRTGERLSAPSSNQGVMYFLLDLHASLLMGLPGTLFLGLMGLLFMVAIISGVVVYAPFMRRLSFGSVRKNRSKRIQWLDIHNMVGIVTITWLTVVTVSGIILTLVTPISAIWQRDQLAAIAAPYEHSDPPINTVSADKVMASVYQQIPDARISFISWPGSPFATPHHYTVALKGDTPLTERLVTLVMVDAATGNITNIEKTPWYITLINLSVPLHFGDYGGLPLKIIWALLDIAAIIVIGSGLYLWLARRRKSYEKVIAATETGYAEVIK